MKRLEIHISYSCPNSCIFCSEKNRLERFKNYKINPSDLKELLKEKKQQGFSHVNFTGGEPTTYEDFTDLLVFTKNLNYKIYIGSNGIFWADPNHCQQLLPLIDEISLSLHGFDEATHNLHTKNSVSHSHLIESFKNINNYIKDHQRPYFFCNSVITNYNYDKVSDLLNWIKEYKNLKQVLLSNIAPEGRAYSNYQDLAVPYDNLKNKIGEWVETANINDLIIRFFGLPLCALGDYYIYSNDLNWDERVTYELGIENGSTRLKKKETVLERKREKVKQCQMCHFNDICGGVFTKYLELYGSAEIIPYKK